MKQEKFFNYSLVFKKELEGGYTAQVPSLPGCITYGKTLDEAKEMVADAIKAYIASLRKHKEPIPDINKSNGSTASLCSMFSRDANKISIFARTMEPAIEMFQKEHCLPF